MAPFAAGWTLVASVAFVHFFMSGATTDHPVEVANTPPTMKADSELQPAEDDEWRPYRREVLDDCLKEGQSVMVMWTADW